MRDSMQDFSSWSIDSPPSEHKSLFSTLSRNIQRYEQANRHQQKPTEVRCDQRKVSVTIPSRPTTVKKSSRVDSYLRNRNLNENNPPQYQKIKVLQNFLDKPMLVSLQMTRQTVENQPPNLLIRMPQPRAKSSSDKHQQFQALKQKQIVFEKRCKKKSKERCVQWLGEVKTNRCPISLRQMDSINKQQTSTKMDIFMKLLRR